MPGTIENMQNFCLSKRFIIAILMLLVTLSFEGIVGSLNTTFISTVTERWNITKDRENIVQGLEYDWNDETMMRSLLVCSYGRLIAPIMTYIMIEVGASTNIGLILVGVSIIATLTPYTIPMTIHVYLATRLFQGLCEGIMYANIPELWAQWSPYQDRSQLMSIGLWGSYICHFLLKPFPRYFIGVYKLKIAFHLIGRWGMLLSLVWFAFVPNTPKSDKFISTTERRYIIRNKDNNRKPKDKLSACIHMLFSKSVWALALCKFTYAFGPSSIAVFVSMYMKVKDKDEINVIRELAKTSHTLTGIALPICGYLLDYVPINRDRTLTMIHKYFIYPGYLASGILLVVVCMFPREVPVITLGVIFGLTNSFCIIIAHVDCVNLAPQCAGLVAAFTDFWYAVGSICGLRAVALCVTARTDDESHLKDLYIGMLAVVTASCAFLYSFFGSAKPQPWSYRRRNSETEYISLQRMTN